MNIDSIARLDSSPFSRASAALAVGMLALVVAPRVATAACRPPPGETAEPGTPAYEAVQDCRWDHRIGLELAVQAGMGMAFDPGTDTFELTSDAQGQRLAPGLGLNLALGWRPKPAFSLGGHLYYQYSPARGLAETSVERGGATFTSTGGHTDLVSAGIYARLYIGALAGARRIDPWIGVGFDWPAVGWVATNVHVDVPGNPLLMTNPTSLNGTLQQTVSSVAIPISAGFDYNVSPELSLGITGTVSLWFPYSQCGNTSVYSATNGSDTAVVCDEQLSAMSRTTPLTPNYSMVPMLFVAGEARFLAPW